GLDEARRADDARHRAPAARRADAPRRAARVGDIAGRDDDPGDPRARAGGCPRRVPERDQRGDGALEGARARRRMTDPVLHVEPDPPRIVGELVAAAAAAGESVVLTGGTSVGSAYEHAASLQPDWNGVSVWWGDERCVPPDDER